VCVCVCVRVCDKQLPSVSCRVLPNPPPSPHILGSKSWANW